MTFSCGLPDGRYVASIYMGALWRTSIEAMNHVVEVDRAPVVNDVRDHNRLMDEEYFRYVHATLVTRDDIDRGGLAVYDNDWDNDLGMDSNARQVLNEAPGWCNAVYSPPGQMIGSWLWEELREGADDDAYLMSLRPNLVHMRRLVGADAMRGIGASAIDGTTGFGRDYFEAALRSFVKRITEARAATP